VGARGRLVCERGACVSGGRTHGGVVVSAENVRGLVVSTAGRERLCASLYMDGRYLYISAVDANIKSSWHF
jgi:hypothetical protein